MFGIKIVINISEILKYILTFCIHIFKKGDFVLWINANSRSKPSLYFSHILIAIDKFLW